MSDAIDLLIEAAMDRLFVPLAEGVEGIVHSRPDLLGLGHGLELGGIRATTEGSGAVGRYLDSLPEALPIVVPFVVSDRLAGMLERRRFECFDMESGCWVRFPDASGADRG